MTPPVPTQAQGATGTTGGCTLILETFSQTSELGLRFDQAGLKVVIHRFLVVLLDTDGKSTHIT